MRRNKSEQSRTIYSHPLQLKWSRWLMMLHQTSLRVVKNLSNYINEICRKSPRLSSLIKTLTTSEASAQAIKTSQAEPLPFRKRLWPSFSFSNHSHTSRRIKPETLIELTLELDGSHSGTVRNLLTLFTASKAIMFFLSVPSHCISFCILIFSLPQIRVRVGEHKKMSSKSGKFLLHECLFPIEVERAKNQGCVTLGIA